MSPFGSNLIRIMAWVASLFLAGRLRAETESMGADDYLIHNFTADDGLRSDTLYALAQDRDGYLWGASAVGLVRFDGARFTVFDRDNTPGFTTRAVYTVLPDADHGLWLVDEHYRLLHWRNGGPQPLLLQTATGAPPEAVLLTCPDSYGNLEIRSREGHWYRWREGLANPLSPWNWPVRSPCPGPGTVPNGTSWAAPLRAPCSTG